MLKTEIYLTHSRNAMQRVHYLPLVLCIPFGSFVMFFAFFSSYLVEGGTQHLKEPSTL